MNPILVFILILALLGGLGEMKDSEVKRQIRGQVNITQEEIRSGFSYEIGFITPESTQITIGIGFGSMPPED